MLLSITIRTFAVPLEPGDYTITDIRVHDDLFGDEPRSLPLVQSSEGELVQPHFTVVDADPCTFVGDIASLTARLPPGDSAAQISMAQEYAGGAPTVLTMDFEGSLMSLQIELSVFDEVIDPEDLSGHTWWLDGEQVDQTRCVTQEATF